MAKATVEITIPDGWEYVRLGRPMTDEHFICDAHDTVCHWPRSEQSTYPAIILRPAWTWPAWLKAPWIAKDDGDPTWMAFESEPHLRLDAGVWWLAVGYPIYRPLYDFTPPPCTDWKLSKRKNPNL
jgi:hypothetical protein